MLLNDLLSYSEKTSTPLVIATTGYSDEQKKQIADASKKIPVFFTYNMSMGVNLLANLAKKAVEVLGNDFDIEIVEKHHNQKLTHRAVRLLCLQMQCVKKSISL